MVNKKLINLLKKQHYGIVGSHSAVQVCRWCKKSLIDKGDCYKNKFYGIQSYSCCQMSPCILCSNQCVHCWRAIELGNGIKLDKIDSPKKIIKECIKEQNRLLSGFKGNLKINNNKLNQSQNPKHFAISLIGEPTLYSKIGKLISELRKQKKTSFLVTNGLQPAILNKLNKKENLPTQIYLSLNSSNKKNYNKWHRSLKKEAWKKFNQTLLLFSKLKTRTVIRMTLVKGLYNNMKKEDIEDYVKLIKKAMPDFIEIKGFMSVGFSRKRKGMGYDSMPTYKEIKKYAEKITDKLKDKNYKILSEHKISRVVLLGKNRKDMKIRIN